MRSCGQYDEMKKIRKDIKKISKEMKEEDISHVKDVLEQCNKNKMQKADYVWLQQLDSRLTTWKAAGSTGDHSSTIDPELEVLRETVVTTQRRLC